MLELLIPVRTGVGGDLLPVDAQREIHLVQKTRDGIGGYRNIDLLQNLRDLLRRLPCPLQSRDGIAGGIVVPNNLNGIDYFWRFFSTGFLPPPHLSARLTFTHSAQQS